MCRIARDFGDTSLLLPPGIDSLVDAPYPLVEAIRMSIVFLKYQEMPADEAPDRSIWLDGKKLEAHFAQVERNREAKFSPNSSRKQIEGDVEENDAASLLLVGDD